MLVWILLPTVLISGIDLIFAYDSTGAIATLVQQQLLKGSAKIISEQLATIDGAYEISVPPAAFELFANNHQDHVFYSVHSKSGVLIAGDSELQMYPHPLEVEQEEYFLATLRGEPVRVIAYKHALPSTTSSDYAVTQIAQTLHSHDAFRNDLLRLTIREHVILLSIMMIGLMIALRWTLSPLSRFGEQLLQRLPGSLEKLDERNAPVELHPIILAMNEYVARLDQTLGSYEQFVANTAHHLRTSFAILTSQINFGCRHQGLEQPQMDILNAIQKSVAQGSKVINQLLLLAAVEQGRQQPYAPMAVNLAVAIQSVMEELAPLAEQKHIELGFVCIDDSVCILAPPHLLREVICNLLDNSIQHMQGHGSVTLSLVQLPDAVLLSVIDTGPGIPEAERKKAFERFYRLDASKPNSSGLGLAIVNEICESLNAQVSLQTPAAGMGLQVDIRFRLPA